MLICLEDFHYGFISSDEYCNCRNEKYRLQICQFPMSTTRDLDICWISCIRAAGFSHSPQKTLKRKLCQPMDLRQSILPHPPPPPHPPLSLFSPRSGVPIKLIIWGLQLHIGKAQSNVSGLSDEMSTSHIPSAVDQEVQHVNAKMTFIQRRWNRGHRPLACRPLAHDLGLPKTLQILYKVVRVYAMDQH